MKKDDVKYLVHKSVKTIKEEGVKSFIKKSRNYIDFRKNKIKIASYKDVLFINGCTLPHPERYRVDHQMEQLEAFGLSVNKVYYEDLTIDMLKYYSCFIFFRCPITEVVDQFIDKAHYFNKTVFFDIDDLVINTKYTNKIKYVQSMSKEEKQIYDDGVKRMEKTLKKCDYIITTTEALARELKSYGKEVFINRNVASERMAELSFDAIKNNIKNESEIEIGYLSGSITHNPDFELIKKALLKIMKEYQNVYLRLVGYLDIPEEFKVFQDRIRISSFLNWQDLPKLIANLDINLAPLEESIFNEAKSENKWTEAALCKVVTVASSFGAFKTVIKDNETGILCKSTEEWYEKLKFLIDNPLERKKIGENAQKEVIKKYITTYSGFGLKKFILSKLSKKITFLLPTTNISGGVNVVIKHCNILRNNGFDVSIINMGEVNENIFNSDGEVNVISVYHADILAHFNYMVATLWTTVPVVRMYLQADKKYYLVQNFETNFSNWGNINSKLAANATYNVDNDLKYITISKWCQKWLKEDFEKNSKYVPNGINLWQFPFKKRNFEGKIKILIEGNSDDYYKNVDESFKIIEKLDKSKYEIHFLSYQGKPKKWYYVDKFYHKVPYDEVGKIYQNTDILIKSSILESFSYPPLEMMATGGICVVAPNEGNIEYLKDGENCLLYEQGNIEDAIKKIEEIRSNKDLRKKLIEGGIQTAKERDWKNIEKEIVKLYDEKK